MCCRVVFVELFCLIQACPQEFFDDPGIISCVENWLRKDRVESGPSVGVKFVTLERIVLWIERTY